MSRQPLANGPLRRWAAHPWPESPERNAESSAYQALEEAPEGLAPLLASPLGPVPVLQRVGLGHGHGHGRLRTRTGGWLFGFLLVVPLLVALGGGCLLVLGGALFALLARSWRLGLGLGRRGGLLHGVRGLQQVQTNASQWLQDNSQ